MEYTDKSTGKRIRLRDSSTEFLVQTKPEDGEAALGVFSQQVFNVTASTNSDGVFRLQVKSDRESEVGITATIDRLRSDKGIESIAPAQIDADGNVRLAIVGSIVVRVPRLSRAELEKYLGGLGSKVVTQYRSKGLYTIAVPDGLKIGEFIDRMNENRFVAFAEPNFYSFQDEDVRISLDKKPQVLPDGKGVASLEWNLCVMSVAGAWQRTKGASDIVVAVVDGLPDVTHESLAECIFAKPDDNTSFATTQELSSHATAICSILAGSSATINGVAPGVSVLPFIVNLNSQEYVARADAILFLAEIARAGSFNNQPITRLIVSCSWQTRGDIAVIRTALEELAALDVVIVFSAGNASSSGSHFPSDYSRDSVLLSKCLLCVAATDVDDSLSSFSNYSTAVDVCAPGGDGLPIDDHDILCADQANTYSRSAGTSMSVPHVAAVAALMLSVNPTLPASEIKRLIRSTCDPLAKVDRDKKNLVGSGRVNAEAAVACVANRPAEPLYLRAALEVLAQRLLSTTGYTLLSARCGLNNQEVEVEM